MRGEGRHHWLMSNHEDCVWLLAAADNVKHVFRGREVEALFDLSKGRVKVEAIANKFPRLAGA